MAHRRSRIAHVLKHPGTLLTGSAALFFTSLNEVIEAVDHRDVGMHHGIMLYAFIQGARVLPELLEAITGVDDAVEGESTLSVAPPPS